MEADLSQQILIRPLSGMDEMHACEQLQRDIWQCSEIEVVPSSIFLVAQKTGGEVLGAFHDSRAVGFTLAFSALRSPRFYLHSHMAAVLPEYQNHGVGRRLKLAQREHALARGIDLIEWTFDPLELKNAHFNIARLGVIVRQYLPDLYGRQRSQLYASLPTDRFIAEWRLDSNRVQHTLQGVRQQTAGKHERISVPAYIGELSKSDTQAAAEIQSRLRREFLRLFQQSYAVTGFELTNGDGTYLLEAYED